MGKLEIEREDAGGKTTLRLAGRVDTNTSEALGEALARAMDPPAHITLDMEAVTYLSSAGLRVLLAAQKNATANGKDLVLRCVAAPIVEVLDAVGFLEFFTLVP